MNDRNKFFSTQMIVEAGVMLALVYVLSLLPIYTMPQGGSISLSMLPIIIFSIRWGYIEGIILGLAYGLLNLIISPYVIHPIQLLLDYPLPTAFVGLSGISMLKDKRNYMGYVPFIILGYALKFLAHFLSGYVFFAEYAPEGMSPEYYSFIYNITYNGPELILCLVVLALLWKPLSRYIKRLR